MKVAVAMSGGVDSSVAVKILQDAGYEVFGITMKHFDNKKYGFDKDESIDQAIIEAKIVAKHFNIPHYTIDIRDFFEFTVVKDFIQEYQLANTPNPCIYCNKVIKFGILLDKAINLGADFMATGHYLKKKNIENLNYLYMSKSKAKDQSYMMWSLSQERLSKVLFPLGDYSKTEIRDIAEKIGLFNSQKKDSQEICFIKDRYDLFLKDRIESYPGDIIFKKEKKIGNHNGLYKYTIGQRKGLGLTWPKPLYVKKLDFIKNQVIVTDDKSDLSKSEFLIKQSNWLFPDEDFKNLSVKIRYNTSPKKVKEIIKIGERYKIILEGEIRAITKGQSAVFYRDELLIGGGFIC